MVTLYDVPAPAKINLFLHVIGRRDDGYHQLQTAFRFIGLYDYLDFDRRPDGIIRRQGDGLAGLNAADDLVVRAAYVLKKATGTPYGAEIRYRKTIPAGGGLGGGSSNAASTLIALNRLWGTGLSRHALQKLGATLGADVPVFIYGQSAFAQGRGDIFEPLRLQDAHYVIVQPHASVSTAAVFSDPRLTRDAQPVTISIFTDWQRVSVDHSVDSESVYFGRNDLEPVVFVLDPGIQATATWLKKQGIHARMTGSGACFFIECASSVQAQVLQQKILVRMTQCESAASAVVRKTWACPGLNDHPLKDWIRS